MFVSKKVKEDRINTCKWTKGARCGKCSCFLEAKATLTKEYFGECPLDKWSE